MKSAEEWEDVIGNIPEPEKGDPHGWDPYWEQLQAAIRAIQADALESVAMHFASEAYRHHHGHDECCGREASLQLVNALRALKPKAG